MKLEFGPEEFEESLKEQVEIYLKNTVITMHIYLLFGYRESEKSSQMPPYCY